MRYQKGTIYLKSQVWYLRFPDGLGGKLPPIALGTIRELATKGEAERKAEVFRQQKNAGHVRRGPKLMSVLIHEYETTQMPKRHSTAKAYRAYLRNRIEPRWGAERVAEIRPLAAKLWLEQLDLKPRTKFHIRGLMRILFDFAMLNGDIDLARNPMDLVKLRGATRRAKRPRILSPDEFGLLLEHLTREPFRTMAFVAIGLGLRTSEFLALQWGDFDWANLELRPRRAIVDNRVDLLKTEASGEPLPLAEELVDVLDAWRARSSYYADTDWVFASPFQAGRLPYNPRTALALTLQPASRKAGLGNIGWHTFRHTYRALLDRVGAPVGVQKELMRHASISTTMNVYGGAFQDSMRGANKQVVRMVLPQKVM